MTAELSLTSPHRRFQWRPLLETFIPVIALLLLIAATAICEQIRHGTGDFLTPGNLLRVVQNQAPVGVVALGMTLVIIAGGIDLSVGSMVGMAGVVGMWLMLQLSGSDLKVICLGLPVMVITGVLAGMLNGVLVSKGRIAPFIATLGGLAAYRSVARTVANNGTLNLITNHALLTLGTRGIPIPFLYLRSRQLELHYSSIIFVLLAIAVAVVLARTRYGRYVFAIGGNERAAVYSAINVDAVKIITYSVAGLLCGVAAILQVARQASVSSNQTGSGLELDAIAAVVIGGTRINGGSGSIFGTVIGVLMLGVIQSMLNFLDIPDTWQGLVQGSIIIVAALVQQIGRRK